jgi:hypothetical protein
MFAVVGSNTSANACAYTRTDTCAYSSESMLWTSVPLQHRSRIDPISANRSYPASCCNGIYIYIYIYIPCLRPKWLHAVEIFRLWKASYPLHEYTLCILYMSKGVTTVFLAWFEGSNTSTNACTYTCTHNCSYTSELHSQAHTCPYTYVMLMRISVISENRIFSTNCTKALQNSKL